MRLREPTRADWPRLLALNLASVRELSELDERRLEWIMSFAHRGLAVEVAGEVVAFALAIAPGAPYDSENYRWFDTRFERFLREIGQLTHGPEKTVVLLRKELRPID